MSTDFIKTPTSLKEIVPAILRTGLLAGLLDGTSAAIYFFIKTGNNPIRVYLYVASSILGQEAFNGDIAIALLGILLHFIIAMIFTSFYFLIYPYIKVLSTRKVIAGLLYGIFAWLVMNLLVLPLTLVSRPPFDFIKAIPGIIILMIMIGLPISFGAHRYYTRQAG